MTPRALSSRCAQALLCAYVMLASGSALADDDDAGSDPTVTLYVGSAHGGDAQLHAGLDRVHCLDCEFMPSLAPAVAAPSLVELAAGISGRRGAVIGGGEAFAIVAASGDASGYAGFNTFVGLTGWRLRAVIGVGLGTYAGTGHQGAFAALAGNARAEVGLRLARGFSVLARAARLQNNISSSALISFGLAWSPGD